MTGLLPQSVLHIAAFRARIPSVIALITFIYTLGALSVKAAEKAPKYANTQTIMMTQPNPTLDSLLDRAYRLHEQNLPQECLTASRRLLRQAVQEPQMYAVLIGLGHIEWALERIDRERRSEYFEALHSVHEHLASFNAEEQTAFRLKLCAVYLKESAYYRQDKTLRIEDQTHPYQPQQWSPIQYEAFIAPVLQEALQALPLQWQDARLYPALCPECVLQQNEFTWMAEPMPFPFLLLSHFRSNLYTLYQMDQATGSGRLVQILLQAIEHLNTRYPRYRPLWEVMLRTTQEALHRPLQTHLMRLWHAHGKKLIQEEWALPVVEAVAAFHLGLGNEAHALEMIAEYCSRHPKYTQGSLYRMQEAVRSASLSLKTPSGEAILSGREESVYVQVRNIDTVQVTLYALRLNPLSQSLDTMPHPVWSRSYLPQPDLPYRSVCLSVPLGKLPNGNYLLQVAGSALYPTSDAAPLTRSYRFAVTDLLPLTLPYYTAKREALQLLNAQTGEPVPGRYRFFRKEYNQQTGDYSQVTPLFTLTADALGVVTPPNEKASLVQWQDPAHPELLPASVSSSNPYSIPKHARKVLIQTDRRLYRPGQTIHFLAVAHAYSQVPQEAEPLPGEPVTMLLRSPSYQTVDTLTLKTDRYGMVSGSFTLPASGQTGEYTLCARLSDQDEYGYASVRAEEYKRPSFDVKTDSLQSQPIAGQSFTVGGTARTLSGAPLTGGRVDYVLQAYYSSYSPLRGRIDSREELLEEGSLEIDPASGHFSVSALLKDLSQKEAASQSKYLFSYHRYTFTFTVSAPSGESIIEEVVLYAGNPYTHLYYQGDETIYKDLPELNPVVSIHQETPGVSSPQEPIRYRLLSTQGEVALQDTLVSNQRLPVPDSWLALPPGEYTLQLLNPVSNRWCGSTSPQETPQDAPLHSPYNPLEEEFDPDFTDSDLQEEEFDDPEEEDDPTTIRIVETKNPAFQVKSTFWADLPFRQLLPGQDLSLLWTASTPQQPVYLLISDRKGLLKHIKLPASQPNRVNSFTLSARQLEDLWGKPDVRRVQTPNGQTETIREWGQSFEQAQALAFSVYTVQEGELLGRSFTVYKQEPDTGLKTEIIRLRDRIEAGSSERFTLRFTYPNGAPAAAARVSAWMYDASLDRIEAHRMYRFSKLIPQYIPRTAPLENFQFVRPGFKPQPDWPDFYFYRLYPWGYSADGYLGRNLRYDMVDEPMMMRSASKSASEPLGHSARGMAEETAMGAMPESVSADAASPTNGIPSARGAGNRVAVRDNFAETAFFLADLSTNERGEVSWEAPIPQSLTEWKLFVQAYTLHLEDAQQGFTLQTYKEFSIEPMMPRFARIGDEVQIGATVRNLGRESLSPLVCLEVFDPQTDSLLSVSRQQLDALPAGGALPVFFRYTPGEGYARVGIRITAQSGSVSDGEQHLLPLLPGGKMLTRAIPVFARGRQEQTVAVDPLFPSGSAQQEGTLTVSLLANPFLAALQSLPYLATPESPNALSFAAAVQSQAIGHYLLEQPGVRPYLEAQRNRLGARADKSALSLDHELREIPLAETPWAGAARSEEEQIQAMLRFAQTVQAPHLLPLLSRLEKLQNPSGHWSWFADMPQSPFLTPHIIGLLGEVQAYLSGEEQEVAGRMLRRAWTGYLQHFKEELEEVRQRKQSETVLQEEATELLFLWHMWGNPVEDTPTARELYQVCLALTRQTDPNASVSYLAMAGIVLHKSGLKQEAEQLARVLENHLTVEPTQGAYFANLQGTHRLYWYNAYMRTQLLTAEFFSLLGNRSELLGQMKQWVLGQRRTTQWDNTLSTLWALQVLLTPQDSHFNPLQEDTLCVQVPLRGQEPARECGAQVHMVLPAEKVNLSEPLLIAHTAPQSPVWGGIFATAFQPFTSLSTYGRELSVARTITVERTVNGKRVQLSLAQAGPLQIGDELETRYRIRSDRAMEFVTLTDTRPGCCEPLSQLSGTTYSQGLWCYTEPRDSETRYYIHYLPRGTYELSQRQIVVRPGSYTPGVATLQSYYAPEFGAGSAPGQSLQVERPR